MYRAIAAKSIPNHIFLLADSVREIWKHNKFKRLTNTIDRNTFHLYYDILLGVIIFAYLLLFDKDFNVIVIGIHKKWVLDQSVFAFADNGRIFCSGIWYLFLVYFGVCLIFLFLVFFFNEKHILLAGYYFYTEIIIWHFVMIIA